MNLLSNLKDTNQGKKQKKRIGRGVGCKKGKTCGRGQKGAGARSGYKRRYGYEGGQMRLFAKLPHRGFTRGRFEKESLSINLSFIDKIYSDGEVVSYETLHEKGYAPKGLPGGIKILGKGEITKKVSIEAKAFSKGAKEKLEKQKIVCKVLGK